jgi:hypothetical protein
MAGELHQVTKSGQEIIVNSRWTLMRDQHKKPKAILVVNTDITQKKQPKPSFSVPNVWRALAPLLAASLTT